MDAGAPEYVLWASLAGLVTGGLVMWHRKRQQPHLLLRWTVFLVGTAASFCALMAFSKAFTRHPALHGVVIMILMTSWVSVVHAVVPLPLPRSVLKVRAGEFNLLRAPISGVRSFGLLLRNTPLRHLGGPVFLLAGASRDPKRVLPGVLAAESVHIWALLVSGPWLGFWLIQEHWLSLFWGMAVQVPLNIYPVLHLRYVTWRLERCSSRLRVAKPPGTSSP